MTQAGGPGHIANTRRCATSQGCNVTRVRMHTDKVTGDFKGFAHVHFKTGDDLDRAVGLDGQIRMGREMRVAYAKPKQ